MGNLKRNCPDYDAVRSLQVRLFSLGVYNGKIDGLFGPKTERSVKAFQFSRFLLPDGIVGPQTKRELNITYGDTERVIVDVLDSHEKQYLTRLLVLKNATLGKVVYGPGRGLFETISTGQKQWVITWGPGRRGRKDWKAEKAQGPSLHCSSHVNLGISIMIGRDAGFTHAGNIPDLFSLLEAPPNKISKFRGKTKFRGYGGRFLRLASDGSTADAMNIRWKRAFKYLSPEEVLNRIDELPPICVWSQSFRDGKRWKWDRHVGFFVKEGGLLYRFASDGYKTYKGGRYSCTSISYEPLEFNEGHLYQVFKMDMHIIPESYREYPIVLET